MIPSALPRGASEFSSAALSSQEAFSFPHLGSRGGGEALRGARDAPADIRGAQPLVEQPPLDRGEGGAAPAAGGVRLRVPGEPEDFGSVVSKPVTKGVRISDDARCTSAFERDNIHTMLTRQWIEWTARLAMRESATRAFSTSAATRLGEMSLHADPGSWHHAEIKW